MASISRRSDTQKTTYKVSFSTVDDFGNKKKTSRSFANETEANKFKIKMDELEEYGQQEPIIYEKKTLRWLIDEYLEINGEAKWSPNTYKKNIGKINNYILPEIGDIRLGSINIRIINRFYKKLKTINSVKNGEKLSDEMVVSIHKVLRAIFSFAVINNYLKKNHCIGATLPEIVKNEKKIWKTDTLKKVLNDNSNPKLQLILNVMFFGTLRPSELSGIKTEDITFDVNEKGMALIKVKREFIRINREGYEKSSKKKKVIKIYSDDEESKTFMAETMLKTKDSERHFWIPSSIAELLKKEITYIQSTKSRFDKLYKNSGFVFINYLSGRPRDKDAIRDMVKRYIKKTGVEYITPHAMRHMSITERFGITDPKSIQEDAGHASLEEIAKRYGHAKDENRMKAVDSLSSVFLENNDEQDYAEMILKSIKDNPQLLERFLDMSKK